MNPWGKRAADRTPEERDFVRAYDRARHAARTPEQVERDRVGRAATYAAAREKTAESAREKWAARSPEQVERSQILHAARRAARTPEQVERERLAKAARGDTRTPSQQAARRRKQRYGLTPEQYAAMVARQNGLCASCGVRPAEHADHDHVTGVVRELLCPGCNHAEGHLGSLDGARKLVAYLERHSLSRAA
jgi:hypothetical protein